jgi:tetratricopeptide (TPR) repeat protein
MYRRPFIRTVVLVQILAIPASLHAVAAEVSFVKDYVYQASEVDSKVSSRAIALEQVKRLLLEQVGTFVQSETTVRDFRLTKDEVVTLTAGIVSVEVLREEWDGRQYALTARVAVDPRQVAEAVDNLRGNAVDRTELESARKQNEASLQEIGRLRAEMETLRQEKKRSEEQVIALRKETKRSDEQSVALQEEVRRTAEKVAALERMENKYVQSAQSIELNNLLEQGNTLRETGDHDASLESFERAIKINPMDKRAYLGRAGTFARMDKISWAFRDIDKALELDPKLAKAYVVRGKIYRKQGDYSEAIRQLNKALKLNPDFAEAYFERGISYLKRREKQEGLDDLKRAANMGLRKAQDALMNRGIIY